MISTILIICDKCGLRSLAPRCDTDPPNAVTMGGVVCPDCDVGGYDMPAYFDAKGAEVSGDPATFGEGNMSVED